MEPFLLEPVELEPVELELCLLQDQDRFDRPHPVELEPQLLVLDHELDEVRDFSPHKQPHLPPANGPPRAGRLLCGVYAS